MVLHDRRADEHPSLLSERRRSRRAGDRDRALQVDLRRQLDEVDASRARSSPPATRSGVDSTATFTTAPSSGSSRSGSRCGTSSTSSDGIARAVRETSTRPSASSPSRSTSCASSPVGCGRRSSTPDCARPPRAGRRAPMPVDGRRRRASGSPRHRDRRLLHRLRGAHQRRQARPGPAHRLGARRARTASSCVASPTTASGGAAPGQGSGLRGLADRVGAHGGHAARSTASRRRARG